MLEMHYKPDRSAPVIIDDGWGDEPDYLNWPFPGVVIWENNRYLGLFFAVTPPVFPTPEPRFKRQRQRKYEAAQFTAKLGDSYGLQSHRLPTSTRYGILQDME